MTTIAERVAAGAEFLDRNEPGWVGRIDLDQLDISSPCRCILGQVFGDYYEATDNLELIFPGELAFTCSEDPDDEGHYLPIDIEHAAITTVWRELIEQRRSLGDRTHEEIAAEKRGDDA
jgi:hypothetical protein